MDISCIVPVYNAEEYISECITSILKQSYKDFELILVNDGSTDRSGLIIDQFSTEDVRIKVIHKENGGVSSARNEGIRASEGKWIMFIDADDWVEENCFETMLSLADKGNPDFIACSQFLNERVERVESQGDGKQLYLNAQTDGNQLLGSAIIRPLSNRALFGTKYKNGPIFTGPVCKLYRRSVLIDNNILFDPEVRIGEDNLFNLRFLEVFDRGVFIDTPLYHYRIINDSAFHDSSKKIANYPLYFEKVYPIVKKHRLQAYFDQKIVTEIKKMLMTIPRDGIEDGLGPVKRFCQNDYCKNAIKSVRISNFNGARTKIMIVLLKLQQYELAYKLYH